MSPSPSSVMASFSETHIDAIRLGYYFSLHFPFPEFIRNRQEVANNQRDAKEQQGEKKRSQPKHTSYFIPQRGSMAPDPLTS